MNDLLHELEVERFKCFENLRLPLRPLTLLTGFNAAGKSTALQPLLLLAQAARMRSWDVTSAEGKLPLNGDIVRLGSAGDVYRTGASGPPIVKITQGEECLALTATAKAGERMLRASRLSSSTSSEKLTRKIERLVHISAVRQGPADGFPIPDRSYSDLADVGVDGRYACHWYHELSDEEIGEKVRRADSEGVSFRRQVDAWLDFLAPGASANVQAMPEAATLALRFRLSDIGEWKRPANVGYGLTYAFPLIVALLASKPGDVLSIDSPEAHLHPQAQSRMGAMLAQFAAGGTQLLVETHSDHILNGVRLAVAQRVLAPHDTGLTFFAGTSEAGHGVTLPQIDSTGRIDVWPDGFFDQAEADIAALTGW